MSPLPSSLCINDIFVVGIFGFDRNSHSFFNRLSMFWIQIRIHLQDIEPGLKTWEELVYILEIWEKLRCRLSFL
jgi:hypothetical protein